MGLGIAISHVFEGLANEAEALDILGPIDYIDCKANDISLKVEEVVEDIENWFDTSGSEKKGMHSDAAEEDSLAGTGPSNKFTLDMIADEVRDKGDEVTDIFDRWWAKEHISENIPEGTSENVTEIANSDMDTNAGDGEVEVNVEEANEEAVDDAVTDFFNTRIPALQGLIAETAKKFDAGKYDDQSEYLQDILDLASAKCWNYMMSEVEKTRMKLDANPVMLNRITEESVKENVVLIATAMFVDMAAESLAADER